MPADAGSARIVLTRMESGGSTPTPSPFSTAACKAEMLWLVNVERGHTILVHAAASATVLLPWSRGHVR